MKVLMLPQMRHFRSEESGIKRVVEAYHKYGPQFGIEYVDEGEPYDLKVSHAGTNTENIDVAHLHGLYWSADVSCSKWEWKANANVIEAARQAKIITVPSEWVAETIRRDMRRQPVVIGHGVDWDEWQHDRPMGGYILYNKNRQGDVCDASPVLRLAVAYTDLDNFKAYNDKYGFKKGDDVILFTADVIKQAVKSCGNQKDFVGHIGGDDFVVVSTPESIQTIGEEITRRLDAGIGQFYSREDRENGFIVTKDRQGVARRVPIVSISIAVVNNLRHSFTNIGEIVKIVTELKKFAKGKEGSCLVIDKRS